MLAAAASAAHGLVPSGDPKHGRDVFVEKGCLGCHSVRSVGGKIGPDLAVALLQKGVFAIAAGMWSHAPAMRKALQGTGMDLPTLSPSDVSDLLSYLLFIGFVDEPGDQSSGRATFEEKGCATCHGLPDKSPGPAIVKITMGLSPIAVAQEMWNHGAPMAAKLAEMQMERPTLSDEEMADIIAFLSGVPSRESALDADLGDPAAGKMLFESVGCSACHLPGAGGETIGPDLSGPASYKTADAMAASMWNHGPAMSETARARGIELPRLQGDQMLNILSYLYLRASTEKPGDATRGQAVFSSKHCSICHTGSGPVNDLGRRIPVVESPAKLASAMWNHARDMEKAIESRGLEWPTLTATDVGDLLAYLLRGDGGDAPPKP